MSSFTRTLQRAAKRKVFYMGRGTQLGQNNPKAKDLIARLARENKNKS